MAMNAATLGTALASAAGTVDAPGIAAWQSIAAAIITHITTNATITVTGLATAVQGGAGTAPVAGTATIA